MKKYTGMILAAALLSAGFLSLPAVTGRLVTAVEIVYPVQTLFSDKLYVSGTVEEIVKKDVTVELPLVPAAVHVLAGDRVEANALLATVDIPATRRAVLSLLEAADGMSGQTLSMVGSLIGSDQLSEAVGALAGAGLEELRDRLKSGLDETALDGLFPAEIRSPAAGTVTALNLTAGSLCLPGTPVCTVSRTESLQVKMSVPEAEAGKLEKGKEVLFTSPATGEEKYVGTVSRIFPSASRTLVGTSQQTTVGFYVALPENVGGLKPGYTVDGIIRTGEEQTALVVPYEAVRQDDGNQEYVYVFEEGRAVRRNIVAGKELTGGVAVVAGLSGRDPVIRDASSLPYEGCLVKVSH